MKKLSTPLLFALLSSSNFAMAAEPSLQSASDKITNMIDSIGSGVEHLPALMITPGLYIFGAVLAFVFVWDNLKILIEGGGALQMMANIVSKGLIFGIAGWAIKENASNYAMIQQSFDTLASYATNAGPLRSNITNVLGSFIETISYMMWTPEQTSETPESATWFQAVSSITSGFNPMIWLSLAIAFLYKFAASLILLLAAVVFVGQLIISNYMMTIAFAMAPIMIALGMLPLTSFLLDGWIKFVIKSGFYQLVGAITFGVTSNTLKTLSDTALAAKDAGEPAVIIYAAFATLLVAALLAYLMMQIPHIVDGPLGGGSLSISGFTRPVTNAASSTARAGKTAAKIAGSAPARASAAAAYRGAARTAGAAVSTGSKAYNNARGAYAANSALTNSKAKAFGNALRAGGESVGRSISRGAYSAGVSAVQGAKSAGANTVKGAANFHSTMMAGGRGTSQASTPSKTKTSS